MGLFQGYGLVLESEINLPDWTPSGAAPNAFLKVGATPTRLTAARAGGARWQISDAGVLTWVDGFARFLATPEGVVVTPAEGRTEQEIAYAFLSIGVGPLLHLRRFLVLHAAAVAQGSGAVLIAGSSGAGKSTLTLECLQQGGQLVADDIAPIGFASVPSVEPGTAFAGAWQDALAHFALSPSSLEAVRPGLAKFKVPVQSFAATPQAVKAVVVLQSRQHPREKWQALSGIAAFAAVRSAVRGARIADAIDPGGLFHRVAVLSRSVPVYRMVRPARQLSALPELADRVMALLR